MTYQEEESTRLRRQASKQAIALAIEGRWQEAVSANQALLENFPNDVDAYNRLGRAHMELGDYTRSRGAYEKALELDPYNVIAKKNLNRLVHLKGTRAGLQDGLRKVEPQQFIEEIGKAGVVNLIRLAPARVLAKTVAGDKVTLKVEGLNLVAENARGDYIGQVESKHGQRLVKLIEGGNQYTAAIISSTEEAVKVIVREVYQDPSQAGKLSFPSRENESFRTYVGDKIIRRELEYEEALPGEPSYTIVGADETELPPEESSEGEEEEEASDLEEDEEDEDEESEPEDE